MSSIPVEVLTDILLRLPAKSLLRFKTVCKLWYDLINSQDFIKLHVKQSKLHIVFRNPILHLSDIDTFDNATELDYPSKEMDVVVEGAKYYTGVLVKGSCRGLLCFSMSFYPYTIFLYNPTTQTHKTLPFRHVKSPYLSPRGSRYLLFGYDHISEDYKCVSIFLRKSDNEAGSFKSQVMVYSLKADSWRRGAHEVPYYFYSHDENFVFLNGIIHWSVTDTVDHRVLPIVTFNLSDETFGSVPLPNYPESESYYSYMCVKVGVLEGCLCLMINYFDYCDLWMMKEYGISASWTNLVRFAKRKPFEDLIPISFLQNKNQLLVKTGVHRVAALDLKTLEIMDLEHPVFGRIWSLYLCSENLLMFKDAEDILAGSRRSRKLSKKNAKRRKLMRITERSLHNFRRKLEQPDQNYAEA